MVLAFSLTRPAYAQDPPASRQYSRIINDSLQEVYGPTTSRYFTEEAVFLDQEILHPIDTVIRNFHRFTYIEQHNNLLQDLGNIGTAIRSVYFQPPEVIGARSGFDAYDLYWDDEQIRYFDTKSPYSNLSLKLGGGGRSFTDIVFSRNINPRWNFGFDYHGRFIDKMIQRQSKGDRRVRRNYYDIYSTYQSKDSTYRLFVNFRRANHEVAESGGVLVEPDFTKDDFFRQNALPSLMQAQSVDYRIGFHLYHQLRFARGFTLYHSADTYYQRNKFLDVPASAPEGFYDHIEVDSARTKDINRFRTIRNEGGIKGSVYKFYYNGFVALRNYRMKYGYLDDPSIATTGEELYFGGRIAMRLDSLLTLSGRLVYLPEDKYRLEGALSSKWFDVSAYRTVFAPSFIMRAYRGSHDYWENDFSNTQATGLNGRLKIQGKHYYFYPGVDFMILKDHVFMKAGDYGQEQTVIPLQTDGYQTRLSPELNFSLNFFRNIYFQTFIRYSKMLENSSDAIQVPEWFANTSLSYAKILFNGNLDMQFGVDMHFRSLYAAPAYDVPTQQFYVQQGFEVGDYPIVNAFFNAKIKKARLFVRYHNVAQLFTRTGYLTTPYYPAFNNTIDFGFDWSFYD